MLMFRQRKIFKMTSTNRKGDLFVEVFALDTARGGWRRHDRLIQSCPAALHCRGCEHTGFLHDSLICGPDKLDWTFHYKRDTKANASLFSNWWCGAGAKTPHHFQLDLPITSLCWPMMSSLGTSGFSSSLRNSSRLSASPPFLLFLSSSGTRGVRQRVNIWHWRFNRFNSK